MCAKNKYDTECKREKGVENDNIQSDLLIIHFPSIFFYSHYIFLLTLQRLTFLGNIITCIFIVMYQFI